MVTLNYWNSNNYEFIDFNILIISIIIDSYSSASSFSFSLWLFVLYHIFHYHFIDFSWVCKWSYFVYKAQLIEMYQLILAIVGCYVSIYGFWFQVEIFGNKGMHNNVLVPFDLLEFLGSFILCMHSFKSLHNKLIIKLFLDIAVVFVSHEIKRVNYQLRSMIYLLNYCDDKVYWCVLRSITSIIPDWKTKYIDTLFFHLPYLILVVFLSLYLIGKFLKQGIINILNDSESVRILVFLEIPLKVIWKSS